MSARMSLSENTAAKRSFGLSCAHAGTIPDAARAAPALSAERRSNFDSMTPPRWKCNCQLDARNVGKPTQDNIDHRAATARDVTLRAHGSLENCTERELVGDIEHA